MVSNMSDIAILKEMLKDSVTLTLESHPHNSVKKQVTLKETDYTVTVAGMPTESEVVVIKTDAFISPNAVFQNSKHECKRADFVIIANTNKHKVIICIELKSRSTTSTEAAVIQQLKGAKCFVAYCQEIGKVFWQDKSFLDDYDYRYVSIRNIGIPLKSSRTKKAPIHDQPERMLKISSPNHLQFNHLTGN
jgi:hypothetical protein